MPMVMVDPKVYAGRDGSAVPPVVALMNKNYSLAGLGLICRDPDTEEQVSCPTTGGNTGKDTSVWGSLMTNLASIFGQAYLNEHQALVYKSGPGGTTVYQQSGVSPTGTPNVGMPGGVNAATGLGVALGSTPYLIMGGMALVAVMMLTRHR